jgi:carbon storage regulator
MLVLSRKLGEKVLIGNDISFVVLEVKANRVRVGIHAPRQVPILREELIPSDSQECGEGVRCDLETQHAAGNP